MSLQTGPQGASGLPGGFLLGSCKVRGGCDLGPAPASDWFLILDFCTELQEDRKGPLAEERTIKCANLRGPVLQGRGGEQGSCEWIEVTQPIIPAKLKQDGVLCAASEGPLVTTLTLEGGQPFRLQDWSRTVF